MSEMHYDELVAQVMGLPYDRRFELAERLNHSLHPTGDDLSPDQWKSAWLPELRRRLADVEAGMVGVSLEEAWPRIAGKHA